MKSPEEINKIIDNMKSISKDGKEEVRALVEAITGVELKVEPEIPLIHMGLYQNDEASSIILLRYARNQSNYTLIWFNNHVQGEVCHQISHANMVEPMMSTEVVLEKLKLGKFKHIGMVKIEQIK